VRRPISLILAAFGGLVLLVVVVFGALLLWLLLTAPSPREVEGWELGPSLPSARGELAMAVAVSEDGVERLYVIGGFGGLLASPQDKVTWLEAEADEWNDGPSLPAARHHLGAAGMGDAAYVSGGTGSRLGGWTPGDNLWRLAIGADDWEELEPMPEARWGHRMVAHDGRLYVVGGHGESADVLIYTPDEGWTRGAEMPAPRDHLSVVVAEGRIWAIGGRDSGSMERVDIYDPEADTWELGPPLPEPTSGAAEGVVNGLILVYGGEDPGLFGGGVFDRHWMLDPAAEQPGWEPAPPPPLAVHGSEGAVFEGTLVIAGGAGRHGALSVTSWTDAVQRLDPAALGRE
jgi:hypothetical protein